MLDKNGSPGRIRTCDMVINSLTAPSFTLYTVRSSVIISN